MRTAALLIALFAATAAQAKTSALSHDLENELAKHQSALQSGPGDIDSGAGEAPAAAPAKADDGAEALGPKSIKLQYHAPAQYPVHYPVAYPMYHPAFGFPYAHPAALAATAGAYGAFPFTHPAALAATAGALPFTHPAALAATAGAYGAYPFAHPALAGALPFHPAFAGAYPFAHPLAPFAAPYAVGTATAFTHPGFQAFHPGAAF